MIRLYTLHAVVLTLAISILHSPPCRADESKTLISGKPAGILDPSLANEVNAAIDRSLDWLADKQKKDGSWSNGDFPALTALSLQSFAKGSHPKQKEVIDKAVKYILSHVQKNGGIYKKIEGRKGGGLSNYNTAICMTALHSTGDKSLTRVIQNARKFIAGTQHLGDDDYKGGFGYDRKTGREYTDLLNTFYSLQGMATTADVEDTRPKGEQKVDINWAETVKYIERMQNKPESGKNDAGGFFYKPDESKAGTTTNKQGVVVLRSYGSMTYAGLLAMIYANVSREDTRVQSAFKWSAEHWSLEENPGMGAQGLYFFYNVLTKSLSSYGADLIPREDGSYVNWKIELAKKLVSSQKIDPETGHGYWINQEGRFWEQDPVLCTAYAVLALEML
ncbi:prenyltransferase/squalene oxidase repeat-containing protein [Verrucomicrobiota bacterium]